VDGGPDELIRRIEALRTDRTSGASALVQEAIAILSAARAAHADIDSIARLICTAQPSMGPMWNAAAAALSEDPDRLNRFAERLRRAPAAIARFATTHFADERDQPAAPKLRSSEGGMRVVTLSYSSSVLVALNAILVTRPLAVSCSESRPALEGRRLATDLAAAGVPVTFFGDSAIAHALDDADAVMVGADAIAPLWFLNKSGTRMLAAAAAQRGVPVYVIAARDKFVGQQVADGLVIRGGDATEIWADPPSGVDVRNPYFESTSLDLVTAVISDVGILGTGMIPDVCEH
jgi:translation initiation factor 2B subunit (eIF-2B alpha/beta/delta family)